MFCVLNEPTQHVYFPALFPTNSSLVRTVYTLVILTQMVSPSFLLVQSSFTAKTVIKVHIISLHLKWIWLLMHKPNESHSHMMWHEHFLHNRIMIIVHSKNKIIVIKSNKLASLPRLSKSKYNCTTLIVTFSMYNTFIFSLHNFNSLPPQQ